MTQPRSHFSNAHFAALLLGLGTLLGVVLLLAGAPLWLYYLAPLLTVPILVRALHVLEPPKGEEPAEPSAVGAMRARTGRIARSH